MKRSILLYLIIITLAGFGIYGLLSLGAHYSPAPSQVPAASGQAAHSLGAAAVLSREGAGLLHNLDQPLSRLFLQLLVILGATRLAAKAFSRFGQPAVVGEMAAGILLGPSLLGWIAPGFFHFIFPPGSLGVLQLLSQIGVCLFMFAVGMELDASQVRHKAHAAVVVSHSSIIVPYFLGVALALALYGHFAQPGASFLAFALFMGISMSITAFPVLARILQERSLARASSRWLPSW